MKISKLQDELRNRGIDPDTVEMLHNGKKITSKDLVRRIQEYEINKLGGFDALSWGMQQRLGIKCPALCSDYKDMKPQKQEECMTSKDWIAEKKLNGVRMLMTYCPEEGFQFFSRNLSVTNFLPVEYTDTILIEHHGELKEAKEFRGIFLSAFVVDTEACCDVVEIDTTRYRKKRGTVTNSQLNAATTILSTEPEMSHKIQREQCALSLVVFDCLLWNGLDVQKEKLLDRMRMRQDVVRNLTEEGVTIEEVEWKAGELQKFYDELIANGEEGVVLKNINLPYCSTGSRSESGFVKRKRTVSEAYGADIDAYITGVSVSNKDNKFAHLIGAVDMSVMLQRQDGSEEEVIIASVGAMPLKIREQLTIMVEGKPALNPIYLRKVLTIDGQDISPKAKRFRHARADWDRGFRDDKTYLDCEISEEFLDSQIF